MTGTPWTLLNLPKINLCQSDGSQIFPGKYQRGEGGSANGAAPLPRSRSPAAAPCQGLLLLFSLFACFSPKMPGQLLTAASRPSDSKSARRAQLGRALGARKFSSGQENAAGGAAITTTLPNNHHPAHTPVVIHPSSSLGGSDGLLGAGGRGHGPSWDTPFHICP